MPKLLSRLTRQLASKGVKGAAGMAIALMKKNGQLDSKGVLTSKGNNLQELLEELSPERLSMVEVNPLTINTIQRQIGLEKLNDRTRNGPSKYC